MRAEIAAADRNFAVRRAASSWRKAGEIDAGAEAAIAALYPDDRVRTSKIFRVLFFIFTWFGFSTAYGFGLAFLAGVGLRWEDVGAFAFVNMVAGAATLVEVLQWHARQHPERPHVLFQRSATETETLTYGELLAAAREVAGGLRDGGIVPGRCVALMLPTGLEFLQSFYGILLAGAIPVPIYPPTRPGQIEDHLRRQAGILQNCEAAALISFDAARMVARILSGLVPRRPTTAGTAPRSPSSNTPRVPPAIPRV